MARVEIMVPPFSASATARMAAVSVEVFVVFFPFPVVDFLADFPVEVDFLLVERFVSAIVTPYVVR